MTLRFVVALAALLTLACATGEPETPPIETGPAVDAAKGPPQGPKLGTPLAQLGGEDLNSANSYGHSYALPDQELHGVTFGVQADVGDEGVVRLSYKAVLPDDDGINRCEGVRDALTAQFGEARAAGVPLLMPYDVWSGALYEVTWRRRARLENGGVVCHVTWGPAGAEDDTDAGATSGP